MIQIAELWDLASASALVAVGELVGRMVVAFAGDAEGSGGDLAGEARRGLLAEGDGVDIAGEARRVLLVESGGVDLSRTDSSFTSIQIIAELWDLASPPVLVAVGEWVGRMVVAGDAEGSGGYLAGEAHRGLLAEGGGVDIAREARRGLLVESGGVDLGAMQAC
nr:hypothetical protein Iba_chr09cCG8390 [Ipomoea batatas]